MIGIFGGTFDPIHVGHLRPALDVLEGLNLAEIRFIPGALPPHREAPWLTAERRAEMVAQAIEGQLGFTLDRRELERYEANPTEPSYTVETLVSLRQEVGQTMPLFLLLGTDAFLGLQSWYRWEELIGLTNIVVMTRPGYRLLDDSSLVTAFEGRFVEPECIDAKASGQVVLFPVTQLGISASDIRERLAEGNSIRYLVPDNLVDYLMRIKDL